MNTKLWLLGRAAVVGGHMVRERVRPRPLSSSHDVPKDGVSFTTEWLTSVLCADVPGAEVVFWSSPDGSSGTSERAALRVEYNAAGQAAELPTDLYTKTTKSLKQRLVLGGGGVLHGESEFYLHYRPAVEMEAPRGYWGGVDEDSWRSMIIMEDIAATKDVRFIHASEALTKSQTADILANMAAYHGAWWGSPDLDRLKTPADHFDNVNSFMDMGSRCGVGMERARDVVPPELYGQADRLWAGTEKCLDLLTEATPTLLHGDSHVGQMYVTGDGRMGIADWQAALRGGWAYDVAYFLGSAVEPTDRRAWEDDLLRDYLDRLDAAGGEAPTFEDAKLAYRQSLFYPYSAWAFTIGRAWYQPKMQNEAACRAVVHRLSHAIHDLDSFGALGI